MSDEKIVNYDVMKKYENSNDVLIIDVRREEEVTNTGKIGGSINIPSKIMLLYIFPFLRNFILSVDKLEDVFTNVSDETFKEKYGKTKPNKDFPLIFTCLMGGRAARAVDVAEKLGYKK